MRPGSFVLPALACLVLSAGAPRLAPAQSGPFHWQEIGKTSQGNPVYIDPKTVKREEGIVSAVIRVTFVKPVKTSKGAVTSARASAMFDCAKKLIAAKENTMFIDEASGRIFEHTKNVKPGFGPAIVGSFPDVAMSYLCK
jgi:hypothetical protein